ncbi:MAG: hypothetical protein ACOY0T_11735 [Myxococcota bacterium]
MPSAPPPAKHNMVLRLVGKTLVVVQNNKPPTDAEWNEFLKFVMKDPAGLRLFVMTDGGAPSSDQRKRLQTALNGALPLVAVISDNMKVRFVAATIALFHRTHGLFSKSETQKAFTHLKLEGHERREVELVVKELAAMLV